MEFSMKDFWNGNRRALARAITIVEDERDGFEDIMKDIYHHTGRAQVIGITGAPGAGKSTLSDALIKKYRAQGKTVGIVAVDPTSPFSGGAILGDRIRMNDLTLDKGVYIRSMGTRGSLGGLSRKTADAVKLMDAFGLDVIFIETVGVGQSEVDIVKMRIQHLLCSYLDLVTIFRLLKQVSSKLVMYSSSINATVTAQIV